MTVTTPTVNAATIRFDEVSRHFGDVVAVSELSFEIGTGVTALLGPNGAGKSTVLRLMCGLIAPTSGQVCVGDRNPRTDVSVARTCGLVPQQDGVFERMDAARFVGLAARLHQVPEPDAAARRALDIVELDPDDPRGLDTYSKGMRQRVKLAQALVHDPEVLVLDEPLTGLDPRQRVSMIALFHRLGAEGRCVVVSSHVLDEVERIGSRILVVAQGRLAAEGDFRDIRALMDDRPHRIRVAVDDPRRLGAALLTHAAVSAVHLDASGLLVETSEVAVLRSTIAPLARDLGVRLHEVSALDDDLESVFRYLVGPR